MESVIYQGKLYYVIHKYDSGFWEIRKTEEKNNNSIILVNSSELEAKTEVPQSQK